MAKARKPKAEPTKQRGKRKPESSGNAVDPAPKPATAPAADDGTQAAEVGPGGVAAAPVDPTVAETPPLVCDVRLGDVQTIPIDSVSQDPANANTHPDRNLDDIKRSLQKFGQRRPIGLHKSEPIIVFGNGTWLAAKSRGWTHIAAERTSLEGAEATAFAIVDNRSAETSEWNFQRLQQQVAELATVDVDLAGSLGFNSKELDDLAAGQWDGRFFIDIPRNDEADAIPEPPANPITKPGDLILLGDHRLLCGDSTNPAHVSRLMNAKKADCVFTSPPYALGIDYGTYVDTLANLRAMLPKLANVWADVICPGGFAVVNFGDIAVGREASDEVEPCEYPMALEYWPIFKAAGWVLWSRRAWCKPNARVYAPWTIQSNRAATDFEHVWTWKRRGDKALFWKSGAIARHGWFDTTNDHGVDVKKEIHGAGMAVGCAARMVEVHARPLMIVHEPFCGTGTTMIACEQLKRFCYGMEINPAYCDIIVQRWEALTGKTATREPAAVAA
jgi:DNA modification methylase